MGSRGPVGSPFAADTVPSAPPSARYSWVMLPNGNQAELHWNDQRIGVYDYTTKIYRRVNTDGELSGPVPFPWSSAAKNEEVALAAKLRSAHMAKAHSEPEPMSIPLNPYTMGGGVTGLILVARLLLLLVRR